MWRSSVFPLAQLYKWKGKNFGQTLWDKIEMPIENREDENVLVCVYL